MSVDRTVRHSADKLALKRAFRDLVRAVGGVDEAATFCRWGRSTISDAQNPNTDVFAAADIIADLEDVCPDGPIVTRYLAQRAGRVCVDIPHIAGTPSDWLGGMGVLAKEAGDVTAHIATALADGVIKPGERATIIKEIDEAAAALAALRMLAGVCDD